MTISEMQGLSWQGAEEKGFHDGRGPGRDDTLVRLALVHTEVSEAIQVVKRHWSVIPSEQIKDALAEELADVLIRIGDLAGCCGLDLEDAVARKIIVNSRRPKKYGTPDEEKVSVQNGS